MSFSLAAAELNVTQSAISRHIKGLEDHLGFPLFKRYPRALELTDQGRCFAGPLQEAFEQLHRATEIALNDRSLTTLNINVLPTLAMKWLIPRLCLFTAANPNIEVRMVTSIHPVDFRNQENDVAIRVAPTSKRQTGDASPIDLVMTQRSVDVRSVPILPDTLIAVCAPSLLHTGAPISVPSDLRRHTLIHTASRERGWPFWLRAMGIDDTEIGHYIAYGHYFMAIQAATEGKGVALVPAILIEDELRSGSLVTLFGGREVTAGAYYLLSRESDWQCPKVKRFREWILKEIAPPDRTVQRKINLHAFEDA